MSSWAAMGHAAVQPLDQDRQSRSAVATARNSWKSVAMLVIVMVAMAQGGMSPPKDSKGYDASFFEQHRKHELAYIALVDVLSPFVLQGQHRHLDAISMLDVGCGHGLLVERWRQVGVSASYCVEGSSEATSMWPERYAKAFYKVQDLEAPDAGKAIEATDYVCSFEVAEHIQPKSAAHFVSLLTLHHPKLVFFSAATPFQDRGQNPSHVNENTFEFWIERFAERGYHVDWAKTAQAKHGLVTIKDREAQKALMSAWWYPKNMLIFAADDDRATTDNALLRHPAQADMLAEAYLGAAGSGEFGQMWRRDWSSFGKLFYAEQERARRRVEGAEGGEASAGREAKKAKAKSQTEL